jgi:hypothetical protein
MAQPQNNDKTPTLKETRMSRRSLRLAFVTAALCAGAAPLHAQVPHALVASPDIYKVMSEDARFRIVEVTWAPGQRDVAHSHPASAVYFPMDCTLRQFGPDGAVVATRDVRGGTATVQAAIAAHAVQNVGAAACKVIMFEPK